MKKLFYFLLFICLTISGSLLAEPLNSTKEIIGSWDLVHYIYNNQVLPLRDPNILLVFKFEENISSLIWFDKRDIKNLSCNREAEYNIEANKLYQKIIWVDPENSSTCAEDPDMVLGSESETRVEFVDNKLHLYVQLSNDWLIYVFKESDF